MSQRSRVLPGFGLSLGFTLAYLSLIVLIPLSAVFIKSLGIGWDGLWEILSSERILKSLQLSFSTALIAAFINVVFRLLLAWCLVRYRFPGKRIVDALVDLPFALPTAVAGIALTSLYAPTGWIGQYLRAFRDSSGLYPNWYYIGTDFYWYSVCGTDCATCPQ